MDEILERYGVSYPAYGVEEIPGWKSIVESLVSDLIAMGWDKDCHQVKEKYGGLRFYIGNTTREIDARIDEAEEWSTRTCQHCGGPGVLRQGSWWSTACADCATVRLGSSGV